MASSWDMDVQPDVVLGGGGSHPLGPSAPKSWKSSVGDRRHAADLCVRLWLCNRLTSQ